MPTLKDLGFDVGDVADDLPFLRVKGGSREESFRIVDKRPLPKDPKFKTIARLVVEDEHGTRWLWDVTAAHLWAQLAALDGDTFALKRRGTGKETRYTVRAPDLGNPRAGPDRGEPAAPATRGSGTPGEVEPSTTSTASSASSRGVDWGRSDTSSPAKSTDESSETPTSEPESAPSMNALETTSGE